MTIWQQITTLILTPTIIVAVLAYFSKGLFQQLLSRDLKHYDTELQLKLEEYKANLKSEFENSKLQLENDLQKQFYRYQTKFSNYHTRQVEVINELYSLLVEASDIVSDLVQLGQLDDGISQEQKNKEAGSAFNALNSYYRKHRIYLDGSVSERLGETLQKIRGSFVGFLISQKQPMTPDRVKRWKKAEEIMNTEVPPILKELEEQFRQLLEADIKIDTSV